MIEKAMVEYLLARAEVIAQIGDRMYPEVAPPDIRGKRIVYQTISNQQPLMLASGAAGIGEARVQLACWGPGYQQAKEVADALRPLNGWGPGLWGSRWIQMVQIEDHSDDSDEPQSGKSRGDSAVRLDLLIAYTDTVPTFA